MISMPNTGGCVPGPPRTELSACGPGHAGFLAHPADASSRRQNGRKAISVPTAQLRPALRRLQAGRRLRQFGAVANGSGRRLPGSSETSLRNCQLSPLLRKNSLYCISSVRMWLTSQELRKSSSATERMFGPMSAAVMKERVFSRNSLCRISCQLFRS